MQQVLPGAAVYYGCDVEQVVVVDGNAVMLEVEETFRQSENHQPEIYSGSSWVI